jgi:hypothetical protein
MGYFSTSGPRAGPHVFAAARNEARVAAKTRPGAQTQARNVKAGLPPTSLANDAEAILRHDEQAVTPAATPIGVNAVSHVGVIRGATAVSHVGVCGSVLTVSHVAAGRSAANCATCWCEKKCCYCALCWCE